MLPHSCFILLALATAAEAFFVGTVPALRCAQAATGRAAARPLSLRMVSHSPFPSPWALPDPSCLRRAVRRPLSVQAVMLQVSGEEGKAKLKEFLDEVPTENVNTFMLNVYALCAPR